MKDKKVKFNASLIVVLLFLSIPSFSQDNKKVKENDISGYFKTYIAVIDNPSLGGDAVPPYDALEAVIKSTFRLRYLWNPADWYSLEIAYSLTLQGASKNGLNNFAQYLPKPNAFTYRAYDLPESIYDSSDDINPEFILLNNLDRFVMTFKTPFSDIIFGRQPIAFGSARIINPTDALAPFTINALDKEERTGVDALRVKFPIGEMEELDLGYVFGDKFKFGNSGSFARLKLYLLETDVTAMLLTYRDCLLLGFDLARSIAGAGVWVEGGYAFADLLDGYKSNENYFRLSVGVDYKLSAGLYGFLEYHFNGAGKIDSKDYPLLMNTNAYTKGSVYLLGMHYVSPGLSYEITPLLNLTSELIVNANDPSMFVYLLLSYSVREDIFIDLGSFLTLGRKSAVNNPLSPTAASNSEFGFYPNTYYFTSRFYF